MEMEIIMNPLEEKRIFYRYEFQSKVRLFPIRTSNSGQILEIQDAPLDSWANDISAGGLRLEGVRSFELNSLLKINFESANQQAVEAYGKIVWAYDNHAGVRFVLKNHRLRKKIKAIRRKHQKIGTEVQG